jgi:hypothetical protein
MLLERRRPFVQVVQEDKIAILQRPPKGFAMTTVVVRRGDAQGKAPRGGAQHRCVWNTLPQRGAERHRARSRLIQLTLREGAATAAGTRRELPEALALSDRSAVKLRGCIDTGGAYQFAQSIFGECRLLARCAAIGC